MSTHSVLSLNTVPDNVLVKILNYIHFDDILNLRLSCRYFYNFSMCKLFFEKVQMRLGIFEDESLHTLPEILSKFGQFIRLNIEMLEKAKVKIIAPFLQYVQDLSINFRDLKCICTHGHYIKRLSVQIDLREGLDKKSLGCLKNLKDLRAFKLEVIRVVLDSNYWERLHYLQALLIHALENLVTVEEVEFNNIHISPGLKETSKDKKKQHHLAKLYQESDHIKHWKFTDFCTKNLVTLPSSIVSLECNNSEYNMFFNFVDTIHLEKLVICRFNFTQFKAFYFENLRFLKLERCYLCDIVPNDNDNRNDILHCPNLKILILKQTRNTMRFFQINGHVFYSSLRDLTLECIGDVNNDVINMISEKCEVLEKLSLINMEGISPNSLVFTSGVKVNIKTSREKSLCTVNQYGKGIFM